MHRSLSDSVNIFRVFKYFRNRFFSPSLNEHPPMCLRGCGECLSQRTGCETENPNVKVKIHQVWLNFHSGFASWIHFHFSILIERVCCRKHPLHPSPVQLKVDYVNIFSWIEFRSNAKRIHCYRAMIVRPLCDSKWEIRLEHFVTIPVDFTWKSINTQTGIHSFPPPSQDDHSNCQPLILITQTRPTQFN